MPDWFSCEALLLVPFGFPVSAHALPALRCSRLGLRLGLRDVRVVRPSRGPRASRACPGHPRSRAAQVVRAPGIFPHRPAPRRSPAFSAETRIDLNVQIRNPRLSNPTISSKKVVNISVLFKTESLLLRCPVYGKHSINICSISILLFL